MPIANYEKIKAECPKCGCSREKIEYWNCGPSIFLLCPDCRFHLNENVYDDNPLEDMFMKWNKMSNTTN